MKVSDAVHLAASIVTVGVFLTGSASLPILLGREMPQGPTQTFTIGILAFFSTQLKVAIVLIGTPVFNFFDTWFGIALARTFFSLLLKLDVDWRYKVHTKHLKVHVRLSNRTTTGIYTVKYSRSWSILGRSWSVLGLRNSEQPSGQPSEVNYGGY